MRGRSISHYRKMDEFPRADRGAGSRQLHRRPKNSACTNRDAISSVPSRRHPPDGTRIIELDGADDEVVGRWVERYGVLGIADRHYAVVQTIPWWPVGRAPLDILDAHRDALHSSGCSGELRARQAATGHRAGAPSTIPGPPTRAHSDRSSGCHHPGAPSPRYRTSRESLVVSRSRERAQSLNAWVAASCKSERNASHQGARSGLAEAALPHVAGKPSPAPDNRQGSGRSCDSNWKQRTPEGSLTSAVCSRAITDETGPRRSTAEDAPPPWR